MNCRCNEGDDDGLMVDSNGCFRCYDIPKVKGRFGLAWVSESPKCPNPEPVGWQVEFCDTPSKVEEKCQEMVRWINCPPLPRCDPCPPDELCSPQNPPRCNPCAPKTNPCIPKCKRDDSTPNKTKCPCCGGSQHKKSRCSPNYCRQHRQSSPGRKRCTCRAANPRQCTCQDLPVKDTNNISGSSSGDYANNPTYQQYYMTYSPQQVIPTSTIDTVPRMNKQTLTLYQNHNNQYNTDTEHTFSDAFMAHKLQRHSNHKRNIHESKYNDNVTKNNAACQCVACVEEEVYAVTLTQQETRGNRKNYHKSRNSNGNYNDTKSKKRASDHSCDCAYEHKPRRHKQEKNLQYCDRKTCSNIRLGDQDYVNQQPYEEKHLGPHYSDDSIEDRGIGKRKFHGQEQARSDSRKPSKEYDHQPIHSPSYTHGQKQSPEATQQDYRQEQPHDAKQSETPRASKAYAHGPSYAEGEPHRPSYSQGEPRGPKYPQAEPYGPKYAQGETHRPSYSKGESHGPSYPQGESHGPSYPQGEPHGPSYPQGESYGHDETRGQDTRRNTTIFDDLPQGRQTYEDHGGTHGQFEDKVGDHPRPPAQSQRQPADQTREHSLPIVDEIGYASHRQSEQQDEPNQPQRDIKDEPQAHQKPEREHYKQETEDPNQESGHHNEEPGQQQQEPTKNQPEEGEQTPNSPKSANQPAEKKGGDDDKEPDIKESQIIEDTIEQKTKMQQQTTAKSAIRSSLDSIDRALQHLHRRHDAAKLKSEINKLNKDEPKPKGPQWIFPFLCRLCCKPCLKSDKKKDKKKKKPVEEPVEEPTTPADTDTHFMLTIEENEDLEKQEAAMIEEIIENKEMHEMESKT